MSRFIERYFSKNRPEDITYNDFINFIKQSVEEHQTLEYKSRGILVKADDTVINSPNPREIIGFSSLAKSVASMANSEGGLLVLGLKEKPEKYRGSIVKVRPGTITPIPPTVTREMIESQLYAKIQYPIEGVTIVPLKISSRSKQYVYLIDVPQSKLAPHRVNEMYYYQRYNFTTYEMKHFQIADLFGRRQSPDLDIDLRLKKGANEDRGHFSITPLIFNRGQTVAKYVTCICSIVTGEYKIFQGRWQIGDDHLSCQFSTGPNSVIYPEIPTDPGYLEFQPIDTPSSREPLVLKFALYAEGMSSREVIRVFEPDEHHITTG